MTDTYYQSPQILGSAGLAIVSGDVWFQAWAEPNKLRAECNDTRPACRIARSACLTIYCEPLFGSMNLFASSGGLPVWANLMLAVTDEVQGALQGELAAREKRIAKYVEKYSK